MPFSLNLDKFANVDVGTLDLRLRAFSGHEELSRIFKFKLEIDLPQANVAQLSPNAILGNQIVFSAGDPEVSYFSGIIIGLSMGQLTSNQRRKCSVEVVPEVWKLTQMVGSRRLSNQTVPEMVALVMNGANLETILDDKTTVDDNLHPDRRNPVQYDEDYLSFLARHMEQEGIFYFFRTTQGTDSQSGEVTWDQTMVLGDAATDYHQLEVPNALNPQQMDPLALTYQPTANLYTADLVTDWERQFSFRPGAWTVHDYDYTKATDTGMSRAATSAASSDFQKFKRSAGFADVDEAKVKDFGDALVDSLTDREEVHGEYVRCRTFCAELFPGATFQLSGHSDTNQNGSYVVTSIEHRAALTGTGANERFEYENIVSCVPATRIAVSCPHATSMEPTATLFPGSLPKGLSPQNVNSTGTPTDIELIPSKNADLHPPKDESVVAETAFVCDTSGKYRSGTSSDFGHVTTDSEKYGRVLIRFPWETDTDWAAAGSSRWVRAIQLSAGSNWGSKFLPRVGEEVIVLYLDGASRKPVIVGSVYNSANNHSADTATKLDLIKTKNYTGGGWNDADSARTTFFGVSDGGFNHELANGKVDDGTEDGTTDDRRVCPKLSQDDVSGIRTKTSSGTASSDYVGNQLLFKDTGGAEEIYIHAEKDYNINVKGDMNVAIGGDKKEYIAGDYYRVVQCQNTGDDNGPVNRSVTGALTFDLDATWGYTTFQWNSDDDIHPVTVYSEEYLDTESRREGDEKTVHAGTTEEYFLGNAFSMHVSAEEALHFGFAMSIFAGITMEVALALNIEFDESIKIGVNSGLDLTKNIFDLEKTDVKIQKLEADIKRSTAMIYSNATEIWEVKTRLENHVTAILKVGTAIKNVGTEVRKHRTCLQQANLYVFN